MVSALQYGTIGSLLEGVGRTVPALFFEVFFFNLNLYNNCSTRLPANQPVCTMNESNKAVLLSQIRAAGVSRDELEKPSF